MKTTTLLALGLVLAAGCSDQQVNLGGNYVASALIPPIENPDVDILFVIDNSVSMADNQQQLAGKAKEALFDVIDAALNGMPNLHIGVITSDMGTLNVSTGDSACSDSDGGALVVGDPQFTGNCPQIDGNFISDVDAGDGTRATNYTGTFEDAFACLAVVGDTGCGFEQHLASTQASLANPLNVGFLRPEALLVVIILADEDDCSVDNPDFFGPATQALGPLDSYRCFQHAITCDEPLDTTGPKTNCQPMASSAYAIEPEVVAASLVAVKGGDPTKVMVAVIAGDTEPVVVTERTPAGQTQARLDLVESCTAVMDPADPYATGSADPAIRLHGFLDHFPNRSWSESICSPVDPVLRRTGNAIGDVAGRRPCLRGTLRDLDPEVAGLQPSCRVFLVDAPYTPAEVRTEVAACDDDTTASCFVVTEDAATCGHALGLRVDLIGSAPDPTRHLLVECLAP
jgi:hypothetical protein